MMMMTGVRTSTVAVEAVGGRRGEGRLLGGQYVGRRVDVQVVRQRYVQCTDWRQRRRRADDTVACRTRLRHEQHPRTCATFQSN